MKQIISLIYFFAITLCSSFSQNVAQDEKDAFFVKTGARPTIDKATSNLNFLQFPNGKPLALVGSSSAEKALSFFNENKGVFPLKKGIDYMEVKESLKDNYGFDHVILQQYYKGVPVFSGILKFHFNTNVELSSINGNFISVDKLNPTPTITKEEAESFALKLIGGLEYESSSDKPLIIKKSSLLVFQKGLVQGYNSGHHLVYEVEVTNESNVREFLYIDAHNKLLVEQFTGIHSDGLDRKLYETGYNPVAPATNLRWTEGETFPDPDGAGGLRQALDVWQQSEVETAGQMYYMMKKAFGQGSYNGGATLATESPMITVNNDPGIQCPNANWNGTTANYCTGVATDDVVAHEWGHAYTEYTSGLIYAWQSGALNESYSDVWGETVDQLNAYFDGGEVAGNKWQMGEQSTSFGGAIRNMINPNQFGDPGKVSDPLYHCATTDAGGVHINSGIPNHAYALLVDGGTFNGQTIAGLGFTKTAHIWWYAQKYLMTPTTDFAAQADNLEAALNALIGVNLYNLSTSPGAPSLSGISIVESDLAELQKVLVAVEMRAENNCGFTALLQPVPAICLGGTASNAIFFEDFEDGLTGWTTANSGSATWTTHNWVADATPPDNRTGTVAFGINNNLGNCGTDQENGIIEITSPIITIPANTVAPNMAFDHYVSMEQGWDGGNIQVSVGGGAFANIPLAAFIANGYNATLNSVAAGNNNPLASQAAFTGANGGSVTGSWGQSKINLLALTGSPIIDNNSASQTIQFKWRVGQDGCGGWDGWYIDDVRVYSCASPTVQFVSSTTSVNEGEAITPNTAPNECLPYVEKIISIKINKAPSAPATITLNAPNGTAINGTTADYSVTPNSVVLDAANLSKDITVRIYNDGYVEPNETFTLSYTINAGGGDAIPELLNQTHIFTITDDDIEPGYISSVLLNENFDIGNPGGWSAFLGNGTTVDPTAFSYPASWAANSSIGTIDPASSRKLIANSDALGNTSWDKIIETAPFNSLNANSISLSFLEYFRVYTASDDIFNESGIVEVWDGAAWHTILTHLEAGGSVGSLASPFNQNISIPVAYANAAMKIRFRYTAHYDFYWIIDKVKVVAALPIQVHSLVNTANPAEAYLGPNETAVFYDPASGDLIAKIKNLSSFDFGCTTVEIDRAGNGQISWIGPYKISAKSFKVTPTTNNPTGQYEITLYYKNAEIAGSTINSMGKISVNSMGNNIYYASGQAGTVFNSDYSYTATFDSGFSGFGLTDAQPVVGPLPVKLISFDGKYTDEGNKLKWVTSSETNNEAFIVERSANTKEFKSIGQIAGKGNTTEKNSYELLDNSYEIGLNYYRLKQLDKDEKYSFSKTIAIESPKKIKFSLSPNPVISTLIVITPFINDESVDFKLVSIVGTELISKIVKLKNGKFEEEMNGIVPGVYYVLLKAKNESYNFKIIKQ